MRWLLGVVVFLAACSSSKPEQKPDAAASQPEAASAATAPADAPTPAPMPPAEANADHAAPPAGAPDGKGGANGLPGVAGSGDVKPGRHGPGTAVMPTTTGRQLVRGGESFALRGGIMVRVDTVTYVNSPCPQGVQCIHSGIIKTVAFTVTRDGKETRQAVSAETERAVAGVLLRVNRVNEDRTAEIEASLALEQSPTRGG